ncbi:MAG: hypothetical protein K9G38_02485 [Bacteroidales bacterium]|nr:hypothetical protein [Bacteroidales bacterium]
MHRTILKIVISLVAWSLPLSALFQCSETDLAEQINQDKRLEMVQDMAVELIREGFNAGGGYQEVWIRDFNTFITVACKNHPPGKIREVLLRFFAFQGGNGNIIDGYIPEQQAVHDYDYISSPLSPGFAAYKNTVETDQESSLIQSVYKYISCTGDSLILDVKVGDATVKERMIKAVTFLLRNRYSAEYHLLWGATTVDWGDVQPEHEWGIYLNDSSHLAIDIYDNAMFILALERLARMTNDSQWEEMADEFRQSARKHLWDSSAQKFIPHIYLDESPFPDTFDEKSVYYHGGTALAIQAGILTGSEILAALQKMRNNVSAANAASIGLTVYPPYPGEFFLNPYMAEYSYQNGGDWTWFGGRMVRELIRNGYIEEALAELDPMIDRVLRYGDFYEWYSTDNEPKGSDHFRGSAGVLYDCIHALYEYSGKSDQPDNH